MGAILPVKPNEPIRASYINDLAAQANVAAGFNADGSPAEIGRGGIATATAGGRMIVTFEVSEALATDGDDDVESCVAKTLQLITDSNTYVASSTERTERLYRVSAGADLVVGDHCTAWFNQQSGRWEIIAGGPGGSSDSSDVCRLALGGLPVWTLPGYESGKWQFLAHSPDNCLQWITPKQCNEGASSSSSSSGPSSSSAPSSSSSSSTPSSSSSSSEESSYLCCPEGQSPPSTVSISGSLFCGGSPFSCYSRMEGITMSSIGDCAYSWTGAKYSGPGTQSWRFERTSEGVWRLTCFDNETSTYVGIWIATDSPGCTGTVTCTKTDGIPEADGTRDVFLNP